MVSLLIASPGPEIYQASGHTAIRLQAPLYNLDNVFSFETDNSGGLWGQLLGRAKGRYMSEVTENFLATYHADGRGVEEYPLNISAPQIRVLWRNLDHAVASRQEYPFNIRRDNCNYRAIIQIEEALIPDKIVIHNSLYASMDNGTLLRELFEEERPWASLLFIVGTGSDCDGRDDWRTRLVGLATPGYLADAEIESVDGTTRPLFASPPRRLIPAVYHNRPGFFTPTVVCSILLLFSVAVSVADVTGKFHHLVRIIDLLLLALQSLGALVLVLLIAVPASIGSAYNWMLIPLNLLPLTVWLLSRRSGFCRRFFIAYGIICLLFTAAPLLTSEAAIWSSLLSTAIAIRVLSHYLFLKRA